MIQVHNLKKKFDDFQALNGVEMHVGKGDIYGLVGPNGAGKSTLIRHLTGAYKADEGEILIGGEPVFENRNRQIWSILMAEVAERKMTVLVSSHNLRELEDTCDHVGIMHHGKIMIERSLSDLQGNISKIQVACQNGVPKLPDDFEVLHMANTGRVYTLIVKGDPKEAEKVLLTENPTIVDVLPLTLEEIFIYELGGVDYEVKDILL